MKGKIDPDLDFKDGAFGKLLDVVRKLELTEFSTMYGSWEQCLSVVEAEPRIRIRPTADYPQQVPELLNTLRPAMVNFNWHAVTPEAVRLAHLGGCHAFVNCLETADTDFYIQQAIDIGADYIQSDRPDVVGPDPQAARLAARPAARRSARHAATSRTPAISIALMIDAKLFTNRPGL